MRRTDDDRAQRAWQQRPDLKLLHFYEDNHDELFDLAKDSGERNNLAGQRH